MIAYCLSQIEPKAPLELQSEKPDFKYAKIAHTFLIEKIEIPEELKNNDDFARIREESKRVGKIIRKAVIDSVEMKKEVEFEA